jgi:hypothetical protein
MNVEMFFNTFTFQKYSVQYNHIDDSAGAEGLRGWRAE